MVRYGHQRGIVASVNGMDRQTLCDWVCCYNDDDGTDGLTMRLSRAAGCLLTEPQMAELYENLPSTDQSRP